MVTLLAVLVLTADPGSHSLLSRRQVPTLRRGYCRRGVRVDIADALREILVTEPGVVVAKSVASPWSNIPLGGSK